MISVIIPVYNRAMTIREAAESVLNQSYKDIELIMVDDGSNDNSFEIMKSIERDDPRVICLKHETNRGACAARNTGIRYANGDYIAFQDSDDEWFPTKLEKQIHVMEQFDVDICFCQFQLVKNGTTKLLPLGFMPGVQKNIRTVFTISTQTLLLKKKVIADNLFDESLPRLQDFDLMLRVASKYVVYYLDSPLVRVMIRDDSITKQSDKLLLACELLREKYPNIRSDYPKSCEQIAYAIVRNSYGLGFAFWRKMILEALKYDCSLSLLLRIPYYYFFRKCD